MEAKFNQAEAIIRRPGSRATTLDLLSSSLSSITFAGSRSSEQLSVPIAANVFCAKCAALNDRLSGELSISEICLAVHLKFLGVRPAELVTLCPYLVGEKVLYLDLLKEFSTAQCDRDKGDDRKGDESALGKDDDEKHAAQNNRQSQPKGDGFEQLHQHNQPKKKPDNGAEPGA